jgi:hypothetical protein
VDLVVLDGDLLGPKVVKVEPVELSDSRPLLFPLEDTCELSQRIEEMFERVIASFWATSVNITNALLSMS